MDRQVWGYKRIQGLRPKCFKKQIFYIALQFLRFVSLVPLAFTTYSPITVIRYNSRYRLVFQMSHHNHHQSTHSLPHSALHAPQGSLNYTVRLLVFVIGLVLSDPCFSFSVLHLTVKFYVSPLHLFCLALFPLGPFMLPQMASASFLQLSSTPHCVYDIYAQFTHMALDT